MPAASSATSSTMENTHFASPDYSTLRQQARARPASPTSSHVPRIDATKVYYTKLFAFIAALNFRYPEGFLKSCLEKTNVHSTHFQTTDSSTHEHTVATRNELIFLHAMTTMYVAELFKPAELHNTLFSVAKTGHKAACYYLGLFLLQFDQNSRRDTRTLKNAINEALESIHMASQLDFPGAKFSYNRFAKYYKSLKNKTFPDALDITTDDAALAIKYSYPDYFYTQFIDPSTTPAMKTTYLNNMEDSGDARMLILIANHHYGLLNTEKSTKRYQRVIEHYIFAYFVCSPMQLLLIKDKGWQSVADICIQNVENIYSTYKRIFSKKERESAWVDACYILFTYLLLPATNEQIKKAETIAFDLHKQGDFDRVKSLYASLKTLPIPLPINMADAVIAQAEVLQTAHRLSKLK